MYKCKVCGNERNFEEINIVKTYVNQDDNSTCDKFIEREDVVCGKCRSFLSDGNIEEKTL